MRENEARTAGAPATKSQVEQALDDLHIQTQELSGELLDLQRRLAPVLSAIPPSNVAGQATSAVQPVVIRLVQRLEDRTEKIAAIRRIVQDINDRLEV